MNFIVSNVTGKMTILMRTQPIHSRMQDHGHGRRCDQGVRLPVPAAG